MSTDPDPIIAEIVVTFPGEAALIRACFVAGAVASGATLYRSTATPWQLKATQGVLDDADWRERLVALVEVLLPGEPAPAREPSPLFRDWPDASFDEYQRRQAQGGVE